uniref:Uncharacterized protein LOC104234957 n=1 Tax=Nicotiana sylvestris TaxID=4096 RepID=A0A1U7XK99_NICSY|nr:PREDICTED: uncharacterized protein LOC104234957 [Nicotiana sylvestris]
MGSLAFILLISISCCPISTNASSTRSLELRTSKQMASPSWPPPPEASQLG